MRKITTLIAFISLVLSITSLEAQWKHRRSILDGTGVDQVKREMTAGDTLSTADQGAINANADKVAPYYLLITNPYSTKYDTGSPPQPTDKARGGFVVDCVTNRGIGQFYNFVADSSIAVLIDMEGIRAYGLKVDVTGNDSSFSSRCIDVLMSAKGDANCRGISIDNNSSDGFPLVIRQMGTSSDSYAMHVRNSATKNWYMKINPTNGNWEYYFQGALVGYLTTTGEWTDNSP